MPAARFECGACEVVKSPLSRVQEAWSRFGSVEYRTAKYAQSGQLVRLSQSSATVPPEAVALRFLGVQSTVGVTVGVGEAVGVGLGVAVGVGTASTTSNDRVLEAWRFRLSVTLTVTVLGPAGPV